MRYKVVIPGDFHVYVVIPNDEFFPDPGNGPVGQRTFSLFHGNPETINCPEVAFQVNALLLPKARCEVIYQ